MWHAAQHFAPILKDGSAGRGVLEGDLVQRIIFDNVCYQTGVEIYGEGFLFGFKPGQLLTAVVKSKYDLREMNGRKIWPLRREAGQNDYSIHNCIAEAVLSGQPISEILNRALLTQISCGNLDLAAIPGAQALSEYHQFVHTFIEAFDPQNVHLDGMNHTVHLLQMLKNPLTTELNLESPKSLERELNLRLEGIASCLRTEATIRLGRTLYGGEDLRLR